MLAFVLPYLYLNATWANWSAYADRMSYWLGWTEGTMHTQQFHWPNQVALLGATFWYAASGVGWPLLAALLAAVAYGWAHFRRWTLALLAPCISYYLIVIVSTGFVYTRFLMPVFASLLLIFALAVRHAWRRRPRSLAREVQRATRRRDVLAALLLLVIGSTAAYTRGTRPSRSWRGCGACRRACPRSTAAWYASSCSGHDGEQRLQRLGRVGHVEDVLGVLADLVSPSVATAMTWPPRLRTSSMLLMTLSYWVAAVAMNTTGMPSSISAIGPCFISAAGMPSAWM
jgi:hypothetical protein